MDAPNLRVTICEDAVSQRRDIDIDAVTWEAAVHRRIAATGNERYGYLCSEDYPDYKVWRARMIEQETGVRIEHRMSSQQEMGAEGSPAISPQAVPVGGYPTSGQQASNLFRTALGFARSGFKLTPKWLRKARLAKCEEPCEKWDPRQRRCMSCGCKEDVKVHILAAECPLKKWPVPTEDELTKISKWSNGT
jgi:hypothetical protein